MKTVSLPKARKGAATKTRNKDFRTNDLIKSGSLLNPGWFINRRYGQADEQLVNFVRMPKLLGQAGNLVFVEPSPGGAAAVVALVLDWFAAVDRAGVS